MLRSPGHHTEDIGTRKDTTGEDTGAAAEAAKEITIGNATGHQGREEGARPMNAIDAMMTITREWLTGTLTASETDIVHGAEGMKKNAGERMTRTALATDVEETMGVTGHPAPRPPRGMATPGGGLDLAAHGNGGRAEVLLTMSGELNIYV